MCKTNSLKARKGLCNLKEKKKNVIHRESNEVLRKFSSISAVEKSSYISLI